MTASAVKVTILVGEFKLDAYQLNDDGKTHLLFTHRQIGEIVGKTKATAQNFLKKQAAGLSEPIKAIIPSRKGTIPLTPWQSALVYWQSQAEQGNTQATALVTAIGEKPLTDFEIITEEATEQPSSAKSPQETTSSSGQLNLIAEGIDIAAQWMEDAGVDPAAVAHWKLTELSKQVPELGGVISLAQTVISQNVHSPTGMIPSQLAAKVSEKLERKVTAAQVNQALHELKLQDWTKPGANRERKLTAQGKQYGVALLTTSAEGWQGAQLRWFSSVIPLICEHLRN
jgi:hypothetical protein